jgi:hypothetical protein
MTVTLADHGWQASIIYDAPNAWEVKSLREMVNVVYFVVAEQFMPIGSVAFHRFTANERFTVIGSHTNRGFTVIGRQISCKLLSLLP